MSKNEQFSVEDTCRLLTDQRQERYPLEKHIKLSAFCTWLHDPNDPDIILHAQIVAAANIYCRCKDDRRSTIPLISIERLARALTNPVLTHDFLSWFESLDPDLVAARDIIAFFVQCPLHEKPSLNKAFHFMENDGMVDMTGSREELLEILTLKRSTATLKAVWRTRAQTSPFLLSAWMTLPDICLLAPDNPDLFKLASRIIAKPKKLILFFQYANGFQKILKDRLDPSARNAIRFVAPPSNLPSTTPVIVGFDARQMSILKSYRVKRPRAVSRSD